MDRTAVYDASPLLVATLGVVLFVAAGSHHLTEVTTVDQLGGPLLAFAIDGFPALGLVYGGYYLAHAEFHPTNNWRVFVATAAGTLLVGGMVALSIAIRLSEERTLAEPAFELLLAATTGAVAGFLAGYYSARSRESAREATQAMATLSFTNSVLRHDIKNDMTVIRGHANAIDDADGDATRIEESTSIITDRIEAVLDTIKSTGAIAETLSEDPAFTTVDLASVVTDTVDHADDSLPGTVTADTPETAEIRANQAVRTVVSNLIENGIEHNDTDDPAVHVVVEPSADGVRLRVLDNGPGVPDAEKRDLFEPRSGDTGSGGLYVVSTLVENYGGDIRIEDNEPRGAAFVVEFPRP
jgi:signal transduction histidine kinase